MNDVTPEPAGLDVRASDAERDEAVALLQRHFADGRLTQAELEERVGAAYAAQTRTQLGGLMADLPTVEVRQPRAAPPGPRFDPIVLVILLWACPPAGVIYWLLTRRRRPARWCHS
jgi:hypothetical protein